MTTVSGALDGMSRMLTRGDGFAVDDFGPVGGARHGELVPRQRLTRARDARPQLLVAEHPVEGSGPGRGIERRDEQSRLARMRSEEHTSELQSRRDLVCRLLLEKKKK